jgi:hypothetical protein
MHISSGIHIYDLSYRAAKDRHILDRAICCGMQRRGLHVVGHGEDDKDNNNGKKWLHGMRNILMHWVKFRKKQTKGSGSLELDIA